MADDYDGLTREDAVRLCVRRHDALSLPDLKFVSKMGGPDVVITPPQKLRLAALVRRLRQESLLSTPPDAA
jgi:hypothetical protein